MAAKTPEEKAQADAEKAAKARLAEEAQAKVDAAKEPEDAEVARIRKEQEDDLNAGEQKTPEQLQAESDAAQAALKARQDQKKTATPENTGEKMYSQADLLAAVKKIMAGEELDADDDVKDKPKTVRLSRFQNRFIVGFKNMNTDEYYPDGKVFAFDLYDEKSRSNVAWATLKFLEKDEHGKDELTVPLETALRRSNKVKCEIVEIKYADASYDFGKVEKVEAKDYSFEGNGEMVKTKVTQKDYKYVVRLPGSGQEITVEKEVVNW